MAKISSNLIINLLSFPHQQTNIAPNFLANRIVTPYLILIFEKSKHLNMMTCFIDAILTWNYSGMFLSWFLVLRY